MSGFVTCYVHAVLHIFLKHLKNCFYIASVRIQHCVPIFIFNLLLSYRTFVILLKAGYFYALLDLLRSVPTFRDSLYLTLSKPFYFVLIIPPAYLFLLTIIHFFFKFKKFFLAINFHFVFPIWLLVVKVILQIYGQKHCVVCIS